MNCHLTLNDKVSLCIMSKKQDEKEDAKILVQIYLNGRIVGPNHKAGAVFSQFSKFIIC